MNIAGFAALAATVLGLIAILVEIGVKNPSAFLEIALDSEAFARTAPAAQPSGRALESGFHVFARS